MRLSSLMRDIKARLNRWVAGAIGSRGPTLELMLGGATLYFAQPVDFGFAISGRSGITPTRVQELQRRTLGDLQEELQGIVSLEARLKALAERCASERTSPAAAIAQLGVAVFSKDHDWRLIFARLIDASSVDDAFVLVALDTYLAYLCARREVVNLLMESRAPSVERRAEVIKEERQVPGTMLLDAEQTTLELAHEQLRRLPPGEAVSIKLAPGTTISLKLARHEFALSHQRGWSLVARDGKRYALHDGLNSVGRSRDNDVPLDADFRNVSRKHLLAEPIADDVIVLTDVSSHGTYVPPAALAS